MLSSAAARAGPSDAASAGCAEALAVRGEALAAVDAAAKVAAERNAARGAELQGIAKEAGAELARTVDLTPCEDDSDDTGLVVDLADLRTRYSVVVERTRIQLDQTAARPVVAPAQDNTKGRGKGKEGTKDD